MKSVALVLSLLLLGGVAEARHADVIQFEDGEPVAMQEGYAYVIARQIKENFATDFVFVRALGSDELKDAVEKFKQDKHYEPPTNVVQLHGRDEYSKAGNELTYVLAIKPGTYILGEQAFGFNGACMCMGSVKFEAKAGVLTDLGYLLSARNDKPSAIPELTNVVQKMEIDADILWMVLAVRPASAEMAVPDPLKALPRVPAEYHAVNKFPNYFGAFADRLTPIPGILGYDGEGNVLDLRTGGPASSVVPR